MRNPDIHDKVTGHIMQALLYDPTLLIEEEGAKRPPCGTPNLPLSCHEEGDEGLINMHEDTSQQRILENAPYPLLSQEKEGSESPITSDSDAAPRR